MAASPPILRGGYRPFFLGAGLWAVAAIAIWMTGLTTGAVPPSGFDPLAWHRHEMLFGFIGAVIAGYLLTGIPNWTGRLPVAGWPLAALFALWLAGRVLNLCSAVTGLLPAAIIDTGFFFLLAALLLREVFSSKNRNLGVVMLLILFGFANLADHAEAAALIPAKGFGVRGAIGLVVVLISVIGGRLVPSFTRNWMAKNGIRNGHPGQPVRFDQAVIGLTAVALAAWAASPDNRFHAGLLALAAIGQLLRMARWRGWVAASDPLVLVLHAGYAWIPTGLAALSAGIFTGAPPLSVAVHALTAGGMATMTLAVMTRTILGQTGRPPRSGRSTTAIFWLVTLGALARVAVPLFQHAPFAALQVSAVLWGAAFALYAFVYGRILLAPRIDNPYG